SPDISKFAHTVTAFWIPSGFELYRRPGIPSLPGHEVGYIEDDEVCTDSASCKAIGYILDGYGYIYDEEGNYMGYVRDYVNVLPCNTLATCSALGYTIDYYGDIYDSEGNYLGAISDFVEVDLPCVDWPTCLALNYTIDSWGEIGDNEDNEVGYIDNWDDTNHRLVA
ncbi:hypothetical protein HK101_006072, partial [Irineochytrium annulatum]